MTHPSNVRVRFAPSPTGHLHVGGARTALFNYLFARKTQGTFLLRVEDTDRERSKREFEEEILSSLAWLGFEWDEKMIRQSERLGRYGEAARELIEKGLAYEQTGETGKAVLLKVPPRGSVAFHDLVHGKIQFDAEAVQDFVIQKSNGYPTYHFASVVDDHDMGITHVIRGDDHISNTPKHLLLYDALGWAPPEFGHLPLVLGPDKTPLSKRHGAVAVSSYREQGYSADGLINYLALLGWAPKGNREFLTREELIQEFDARNIHATNACFDSEKLKWLNGEHLRRMTNGAFTSAVRTFFESGPERRDCNLERAALLFRERIRYLGELKTQASYLFDEEIRFDSEAVKKYFSGPETRKYLEDWRRVLEAEGDFAHPEALEALLRRKAEELGIHPRQLIHPTRVAVSGRSATPGLFEVLSLLGRQKVLTRIQHVILHYSELAKTV